MSPTDLTSRFENYFGGVTTAIRSALSDTTEAIVKSAQNNAPQSVQNSIKAVIASDGLAAVISSGSPHARQAEYSAGTAAPQPPHEVKDASVHHAFPASGVSQHNRHAAVHPTAGHTHSGLFHAQKKDASGRQPQGKPFLNPAFEEQAQLFIDKLKAILSGR